MQEEISQDCFNHIIIEAVDETLSMLGKDAKTLVYLHMCMDLKISKQDIPNRLCEFRAELEKLLGQGAKPFEEQLVRCLQYKTSMPFLI
jgi:hypothetical protein